MRLTYGFRRSVFFTLAIIEKTIYLYNIYINFNSAFYIMKSIKPTIVAPG